MKNFLSNILLFVLCFLFGNIQLMQAQCSVCARTTEQLDPRAAEDFNVGVIYLMLTPLLIIGVVGYFWYKHTHK